MLYCDNVLTMRGSDGNNTPLTAAILAAGLDGPPLGGDATKWFTVGTAIAVSDDFTDTLPSAYYVRNGNFWLPTNGFRSFRIDNNTAFTDAELELLPLAARKIVVFGLMKLNIPDQGTGSMIYDLIRVTGTVEGFVVLQLNSGQGLASGGYAINIECNPGTTTTHSTYITLVPGNSYWFCMYGDFSTTSVPVTAFLNVYDYPSGTLIGAVSNRVLGTTPVAQAPNDIGDIRIGNGEEGLADCFSYYKGLAWDVTNPTFPRTPWSASKLPNSGKRPRPFAPGNAR